MKYNKRPELNDCDEAGETMGVLVNLTEEK